MKKCLDCQVPVQSQMDKRPVWSTYKASNNKVMFQVGGQFSHEGYDFSKLIMSTESSLQA